MQSAVSLVHITVQQIIWWSQTHGKEECLIRDPSFCMDGGGGFLCEWKQWNPLNNQVVDTACASEEYLMRRCVASGRGRHAGGGAGRVHAWEARACEAREARRGGPRSVYFTVWLCGWWIGYLLLYIINNIIIYIYIKRTLLFIDLSNHLPHHRSNWSRTQPAHTCPTSRLTTERTHRAYPNRSHARLETFPLRATRVPRFLSFYFVLSNKYAR
jgi:hypothetical protein